MAEKVAVVTAGGSGMGTGAARRLAREGFRIAILSSSGRGKALAKELGGIGVTASNESSDDLKHLVDRAVERWGRIDALVNSGRAGERGGCVAARRSRDSCRAAPCDISLAPFVPPRVPD